MADKPSPESDPNQSSDPTTDTTVFATDKTFADLGLSKELVNAIKKLGWVHPTHVQAQLIPLALAKRDVMAQSKTGTGKTAAFGLPVLESLTEKDAFAALILVPTRELAIQVGNELRELTKLKNLRVVPVYGGQRMPVQIEKLEKNPQIIVGTPGRVMDMHERGYLPYKHIKWAILDEVDRMLDIGFRDDIRKILGRMGKNRTTVFVSATISPEIQRLSHQYMNKPEELTLSTSSSLTVKQVTQRYVSVEPWDKKQLMLHVLKKEDPGLTVIFCRTKQTVDKLTEYLQRKGVDTHAIHGDMYQRKRNRVMEMLRAGELSVLVASDLAARGLDVDDITHVINYDVPEDPEVYVHRIGRTARAGRDGWALAFVAPDQGNMLTNIEMLTNCEIEEVTYDDFKPGPVPRGVREEREEAQKRKDDRANEQNRYSAAPPAPKTGGDVDESAFPGGKVPVSRPNKRLGGRLRSGRRR